MLPELGVQWLCASSYNRAGMQHNEGGNPGKKDPFLQLMEMGMAEKGEHACNAQRQLSTLGIHFAPPLCNRQEGIIRRIEVENDETVV